MSSQQIRLALTYTTYDYPTVTLPEGMRFDDILDWWVKWDGFYVRLRDDPNRVIELLFESNPDSDLKRPDTVRIYNADETVLLADSEGPAEPVEMQQ